MTRSVSAPTFETIGGALDLKFKTQTYIGLMGEVLHSDVERKLGVFNFVDPVAVGEAGAARGHRAQAVRAASGRVRQVADVAAAAAVGRVGRDLDLAAVARGE